MSDNNSTGELIEKGNIDLKKRKVLNNPDGSISTESSISVTFDDFVVNIPTVLDGVRVSEDDAIKSFMKSGKHLGKYKSVKSAEAAAENTHLEQQDRYLLNGNK